jgi:hypothetical protein
MEHRLYAGDNAHAWHALRWPQFAEFKKPETALVIQPIYSISDWAMGRPMDAEEVAGSAVLDGAITQCSESLDALVLPAMRYTPKQSVGTAFGLDIEVAHRIMVETITSAAEAGFKRFVLFNTSPFLEEWIDVAARDLRVQTNLQMFCLNFSGIGLDFHPVRGGARAGLQSLLTYLLDEAPEDVAHESNTSLDPIARSVVLTRKSLGEDPRGAGRLLSNVASELARLLREIASHPTLCEVEPDKEASE